MAVQLHSFTGLASSDYVCVDGHEPTLPCFRISLDGRTFPVYEIAHGYMIHKMISRDECIRVSTSHPGIGPQISPQKLSMETNIGALSQIWGPDAACEANMYIAKCFKNDTEPETWCLSTKIRGFRFCARPEDFIPGKMFHAMELVEPLVSQPVYEVVEGKLRVKQVGADAVAVRKYTCYPPKILKGEIEIIGNERDVARVFNKLHNTHAKSDLGFQLLKYHPTLSSYLDANEQEDAGHLMRKGYQLLTSDAD
ncbi:hypothetical protein [Wenling hagfish virus]|uniref:Uncharacterized protein n=1 Tax=Wenling hagfish virus TaxID=2116438 RepID=A0A2P1GNY3_9VIRU|nr:hypothetical protein [Wenling hagfish virus]